ncbi:hypothetical protein PVAP13_8KG072851 [Panicum virgatum]|uniref:Uncharacterized protein n=1 Tax=Panicum virgatum TaxID=38727 RepID=A0A8T0PHX2_PANVG|nr:hypothetical protein PVAP13_8KG072851 [Panicum virgatum]
MAPLRLAILVAPPLHRPWDHRTGGGRRAPDNGGPRAPPHLPTRHRARAPAGERACAAPPSSGPPTPRRRGPPHERQAPRGRFPRGPRSYSLKVGQAAGKLARGPHQDSDARAELPTTPVGRALDLFRFPRRPRGPTTATRGPTAGAPPPPHRIPRDPLRPRRTRPCSGPGARCPRHVSPLARGVNGVKWVGPGPAGACAGLRQGGWLPRGEAHHQKRPGQVPAAMTGGIEDRRGPDASEPERMKGRCGAGWGDVSPLPPHAAARRGWKIFFLLVSFSRSFTFNCGERAECWVVALAVPV